MRADPPRPVLLRPAKDRDWPTIMAIETATYEPGRRDSEAYLRRGVLLGLGLVACEPATGEILGFCFGAPIEAYRDTPGPAEDPRQGLGDTFFSADCTVTAAARQHGVGRQLKRAQLAWCRAQGFRFVTGRTRVGVSAAMQAINHSFGAVVLGQVQRPEGLDHYYQISLVDLDDDLSPRRPA